MMAILGEALVALLVGVLLAPVGAIMGSVLLFGVGLAMFAGHPPGIRELIGMSFYGTIPGFVLAAPVTAIALPAIYGVMRWRSALSLRRLTIAGAACGVLSATVASIAIWWVSSGEIDHSYWTFMLGVAVDGALVAALCANGFGRILRSLRPQAWPAPPAKPAA